jgi:hypothetical protein
MTIPWRPCDLTPLTSTSLSDRERPVGLCKLKQSILTRRNAPFLNFREWILDQHKEKKPKDPTIREKFNTSRFADYKEKVIDLLMRVTTVSMRTVAVVEAMRKVAR